MDNLMNRLANTMGRQQRRARQRSIQNRSPVPFTNKQPSMYAQLMGESGGQREFDAYGSMGTLFAIVSQNAQRVASAEWHLFRKTSMQDEKRRKEVTSHGFLDVWNKPNEFWTGFQQREAVQQHLDLVGEGYLILSMIGNIVFEMWHVRPDRMQPVKHPTKYLTGWIYIGPDGEEVPLRKEQVIQLKYPNPSDHYRGMGPVQTVLHDIDASRYSAEWNRNFFVNGAKPGGVIEIDYRMSDEQFEEFVERWHAQHKGVANAHRVAVLENAKWKDSAFSMTDMQFAELRSLSSEFVREAFAYPKPMLGTVDDVNRANAEAGKEMTADTQTKPRLDRWKDVINAYLLPRFQNGKNLEHDYEDPTPINYEAKDRERDSQAKAAAVLRTAGWHQDDILEAVGLPKMRYVGLPETTTKEPTKDGDKKAKEPAKLKPAAKNGTKSLIDVDYSSIFDMFVQ